MIRQGATVFVTTNSTNHHGYGGRREGGPPSSSMMKPRMTGLMGANDHRGHHPPPPSSKTADMWVIRRDTCSPMNHFQSSRIMDKWIQEKKYIVYPIWIGNVPPKTSVSAMRRFVESKIGPVIVSLHIESRLSSNRPGPNGNGGNGNGNGNGPSNSGTSPSSLSSQKQRQGSSPPSGIGTGVSPSKHGGPPMPLASSSSSSLSNQQKPGNPGSPASERTWAFVNLPTSDLQHMAVTLLHSQQFQGETLIVRPKRSAKFPHSPLNFQVGPFSISPAFKVFHDQIVPQLLASRTNMAGSSSSSSSSLSSSFSSSGSSGLLNVSMQGSGGGMTPSDPLSVIPLTVDEIGDSLSKHGICPHSLPNRLWAKQCTLAPQCPRSYCSFYHNPHEKEMGRMISLLKERQKRSTIQMASPQVIASSSSSDSEKDLESSETLQTGSSSEEGDDGREDSQSLGISDCQTEYEDETADIKPKPIQLTRKLITDRIDDSEDGQEMKEEFSGESESSSASWHSSESNKILIMSNLPHTATHSKCHALFTVFGEIEDLVVTHDRICGIKFNREQDALKVVRLLQANSDPISVKFAQDPSIMDKLRSKMISDGRIKSKRLFNVMNGSQNGIRGNGNHGNRNGNGSIGAAGGAGGGGAGPSSSSINSRGGTTSGYIPTHSKMTQVSLGMGFPQTRSFPGQVKSNTTTTTTAGAHFHSSILGTLQAGGSNQFTRRPDHLHHHRHRHHPSRGGHAGVAGHGEERFSMDHSHYSHPHGHAHSHHPHHHPHPPPPPSYHHPRMHHHPHGGGGNSNAHDHHHHSHHHHESRLHYREERPPLSASQFGSRRRGENSAGGSGGGGYVVGPPVYLPVYPMISSPDRHDPGGQSASSPRHSNDPQSLHFHRQKRNRPGRSSSSSSVSSPTTTSQYYLHDRQGHSSHSHDPRQQSSIRLTVDDIRRVHVMDPRNHDISLVDSKSIFMWNSDDGYASPVGLSSSHHHAPPQDHPSVNREMPSPTLSYIMVGPGHTPSPPATMVIPRPSPPAVTIVAPMNSVAPMPTTTKTTPTYNQSRIIPSSHVRSRDSGYHHSLSKNYHHRHPPTQQYVSAQIHPPPPRSVHRHHGHLDSRIHSRVPSHHAQIGPPPGQPLSDGNVGRPSPPFYHPL